MSKPPPKSDQPLSSFGNELLATLRHGADRELRITFDSAKMAIRFQQRINQFRQAHKKAQVPGWEQLYRCGMHLDDTNPRVLVLAPKDSEFRKFLLDAKIEVDSPAPVSEVAIHTPLPGADADSFLSTLVDVTAAPEVEKKSDEG